MSSMFLVELKDKKVIVARTNSLLHSWLNIESFFDSLFSTINVEPIDTYEISDQDILEYEFHNEEEAILLFESIKTECEEQGFNCSFDALSGIINVSQLVI